MNHTSYMCKQTHNFAPCLRFSLLQAEKQHSFYPIYSAIKSNILKCTTHEIAFKIEITSVTVLNVQSAIRRD